MNMSARNGHYPHSKGHHNGNGVRTAHAGGNGNGSNSVPVDWERLARTTA